MRRERLRQGTVWGVAVAPLAHGTAGVWDELVPALVLLGLVALLVARVAWRTRRR